MKLLSEEIVYGIDENDNIVFANNQWDTFAEANDGQAIKFSSIAQRPLWDFVADESTRQIYRLIVEHVRADRSIEFGFRCDSPDFKRQLQMRIVKTPEGIVEFHTQTKAVESVAVRKLLDSRSPRNGEYIKLCSWCTRIYAEDDWLDLDQAIRTLGYFHEPELPLISHSICDVCMSVVTAAIDQ